MTSGKRSRERHRMEREYAAKEEFEAEQLKIMQENFQVFACTGSQYHSPDCDHNCEVVQLEGYDLEIAKESVKWQELELMPVGTLPQTPIPGIGVNTFNLETAFQALVDFIIEKGLATKAELDERYAKAKLERMQEIRRVNEPRIRESQRMRDIAVTQERPKLVIPPVNRPKLQ